MVQKKSLTVAGLAALLALHAAPAAAQGGSRDDRDRLLVSIGAGPKITPDYPGADSYSLGPLITGLVRKEGEPIAFRAPDDGFGFSVTGRGGLVEFGPLVELQGERKEEDAGLAIGDVDTTVEGGLFLNLNVAPDVRLRTEVRRGIGGHDSFLGNVGIDFAMRRGLDTLVTIGPRLRWADSDYMRTYFGVTPAIAARTGLAPYTPDGGLRAAGIIGSVTHQLSRSFGIYGYAGYDRLIGDAADSPIVRRLGSPDQFSAGIALYFTFSIRNPF